MSEQCRQAAWQKRAVCACSLLPAHKHALGAAALYTGLRRAVERLSRLTVLATLRACRPAHVHIFVAKRKPQSSSQFAAAGHIVRRASLQQRGGQSGMPHCSRAVTFIIGRRVIWLLPSGAGGEHAVVAAERVG